VTLPVDNAVHVLTLSGMNATLLYSVDSLPSILTTVVIGDTAMECSIGCAIRTVGHFTGNADHYTVVAVVPVGGDDEGGCEEVFARFNIGDRAGLRCRSMSVGDVVVFGSGAAFVCKGCGWERVSLSNTFKVLHLAA